MDICRWASISDCANCFFMNNKDFLVNDESLKFLYFEGSLEAGRELWRFLRQRWQIIVTIAELSLSVCQLPWHSFNLLNEGFINSVTLKVWIPDLVLAGRGGGLRSRRGGLWGSVTLSGYLRSELTDHQLSSLSDYRFECVYKNATLHGLFTPLSGIKQIQIASFLPLFTQYWSAE